MPRRFGLIMAAVLRGILGGTLRGLGTGLCFRNAADGEILLFGALLEGFVLVCGMAHAGSL